MFGKQIFNQLSCVTLTCQGLGLALTKKTVTDQPEGKAFRIYAFEV